MSREDHRKHDAALELLREQQKTIIAQREGISSGDIALWFLAACMALGLFLAAPKLGRDVTREAGWTVVGNQVERGAFSKPMSGVVLIRPRAGGEVDPSKWNSGLWAAITPSLENVRRAFVNMEIEPDSMVDSSFPSGVMGVCFGPEKEDAAEETPLTKTMKQIEESRRKQRRP